jgi:ribosomal protein L16/L10AE
MKQYPSNLKYKKYHKLNSFNLKTIDKKNFHLDDGVLAIKSVESGKITFKQIESCRRTIKRGLKKIGNL